MCSVTLKLNEKETEEKNSNNKKKQMFCDYQSTGLYTVTWHDTYSF